jgi:hypothetical protein
LDVSTPGGDEAPIDVARLRDCAPGRRADLLRKALRTDAVDHDAVARDLEDWLRLFRGNRDPGFLVLILELLSPLSDARVLELAREAATHRGDGVRLEALRVILDRRPDEAVLLTERHRDDDSLEVRLLLAERLYDLDRQAAVDLAFEILESECEGPRETHALERVTEFLVEAMAPREQAARRHEIAAKIRLLRPRFEDAEGFLDWAATELERSGPKE